MNNIWNSALTNEQLVFKFKGMLGDFFENYDVDYVGNYLIELQCNYYHHEFIRRAVLLSMEKALLIFCNNKFQEKEGIENLIKLVHSLNTKYNVHAE